MNLFQALEQSLSLNFTQASVFEGVFSGKFLLSKGKQNVDEDKEYLCLIDMKKRTITVLGVQSPEIQPPLVE